MPADLVATAAAAEPDAPGPHQAQDQIRRLAWLHFANDLTLDFITPLLTALVNVGWIGLMEGAADGIGQVLKLVTGRASDRQGVRAPWVRSGYVINAIARPLIGIGMVLGWPLWVVACRIGDRVGKGVRGSATDALVADWADRDDRVRAFARMRTMDHLGATLGGLAAAAAAYVIALRHLWIAVCALVVVTLWVAHLARGLTDRRRVPVAPVTGTGTAAPGATPPVGWWPRSKALRAPLLAIGVATMATKLSPLLVLAQVAGLPAHAQQAPWPLWQVCLGWAALGLVQAGAAALAGLMTIRLGAAGMARLGWLAGAVIFVGLAQCHGWGLVLAGAAFGILVGFTEGAEKTWIADRAATSERSLSFGALAVVTAITGLLGNALFGWLLVTWGPKAFLVMALIAILGVLTSLGAGRSVPVTPAAS